MNEINNNYMEWLEKEILENGNFDTKSIILNNLSEEEKKNIEKFEYFYNIISKYAKENNIEEYWCNNYSTYNIKYNDNCYNIIKDNNENKYICLKKKDDNFIGNYIDINKMIEKDISKVYQKKSQN